MQFIYKAVPFRGRVETIDITAVASQLTDLINSEATGGWDFYQINSVSMMVSPGCLLSLFGAPSFPMSYDMAIFRKSSGLGQSESMEKSVDAHALPKIQEEDQTSPEVIERKNRAQPVIDKITGVGYKLISSRITKKSEIWEFEFTSNGSRFEVTSFKDLKDFAKNF